MSSKLFKKMLKKIFKRKPKKEPRKCQDCNWCMLKKGRCEDCDSRLCNEPSIV